MATYGLPTAPDGQPGPSLHFPSTSTLGYPAPSLVPATFPASVYQTGPHPHAQPRRPPQPSSSHGVDDGDGGSAEGEDGKKKKAKRRKVNHACLYCRRSHMTCDEGRPCQRCIKREIGHLCHDEPRQPSKPNEKTPTPTTVAAATTSAPPAPRTTVPSYTISTPIPIAPAPASLPSIIAAPAPPPVAPWPALALTQNAPLYPPETLRSEFAVLTDFLDTLDERAFFAGAPAPPAVAAAFPSRLPNAGAAVRGAAAAAALFAAAGGALASDVRMTSPSIDLSTLAELSDSEDPGDGVSDVHAALPPEKILPAATKEQRFLLTAADQQDGSRVDRLNRVIHSKYEAGLLKPYNYVKGYARLSRWMDRNVSQESKQAILQPLSILRPKFRAVAQSLTDLDHVFIEEAFERLLLDYDRVFSAMGIPACLWRRTGEIYKGNREFAELVGVDNAMLRDGKLCIYELMAEHSAVNYWEKYGHIAFDSTQKAVLTNATLRFRPTVALVPGSVPTSTSALDSPGGSGAMPSNTLEAVLRPGEEELIACCFSITIRRDTWGIPSIIVGNFIRC